MLIRPATPEDAAYIARAILIADRAHGATGIWAAMLGNTEEYRLRFLENLAVTDTPHFCHYSCHIIAEEDGAPAGSLAGCDPGTHGREAIGRAAQQAGELTMRQAGRQPSAGEKVDDIGATLSRAARLLDCMPSELADAWMIDNVATMPEHRGKGVARSLLTEILEEGRRQGFARAQLSVLIGNKPALRLYRRVGFEVVKEKRDAYFEKVTGSPGMVVMVSEL